MIDRIRQAVDAKPEYDFRGEEAVLHRVEVDGRMLWAKKWYRTHEKPLSIRFALKGAGLSAYWHKVKEAEYRLINALFPDETVKMVGSYDERIRRRQGQPAKFRLLNGRPVTVTEETVGDPDLIAGMRAILAPAYAETLAYRDALQNSGRPVPMDEFFMDWRTRVNDQVHTLLGNDDLDVGPVMTHPSQATARISEVARRSPRNVMVDMLRAGITPVHPEVNFIPGTEQTHRRPPHGTFVELHIYDINRLKIAVGAAFRDDPGELARLNLLIDRYLLFRELDKIFDEVITGSNFAVSRVNVEVGDMIMNPVVQSAFFRAMEALEEAHYRGAINAFEVTDLKASIFEAFARFTSPAWVANYIDNEITAVLERM